MLSYVYDLGWARRERSLFFDLSVAHEDVTCQQRHGVIAAPSRPTYARGLLDSSLADLVSHEIVIGQVYRLAGSLSGHHVSGTPGITPPTSPRREEGDFGGAADLDLFVMPVLILREAFSEIGQAAAVAVHADLVARGGAQRGGDEPEVDGGGGAAEADLLRRGDGRVLGRAVDRVAAARL